MDVHPNSRIFVDVISWRWERGVNPIQTPIFCVEHSVNGIYGSIPMDKYKIKIEASGKNAKCEPRVFSVGLKEVDGRNKIWLWASES